MATRSSAAKNSAALDPALPQKKRARRRLVGAAAIALAAAIVLPLVLDSEPRQVHDDVQVSIPSRDTPLNERTDVASAPAASTGTITPYGDATNSRGADTRGADTRATDSRYGEQPAPGEPGANDAGSTAPTGADGGAVSAPTSPESNAEAKPAAKPEVKPVAKTAVRNDSTADARSGATADAKPAAKTDTDSEAKSEPRTLAKLDPPDPKSQAPDAPSRPHLLQVGAFSTAKAASEQAGRVQKLGVKTYTEKIQTSKGERIRVRIGPFASREAADRARAKLKSAGIESALVAP